MWHRTTDLAVAVNINLLLIPKVFSNLSYRSPPISKQLQIRAQSGGRGASHSCQCDIWRTPWGSFFIFGKSTFWGLSQAFKLQVQYHLTYKCLIGKNYEVMTFDKQQVRVWMYCDIIMFWNMLWPLSTQFWNSNLTSVLKNTTTMW